MYFENTKNRSSLQRLAGIHQYTKKTMSMKPEIHPEYREVLFHDTSADAFFVIGSTISSSEIREHEGKSYPYVAIDVSSASHPFYTGKQKSAQNDGRVAKFNKRYGRQAKS